MSYVPNTDADRARMLQAIGVSSMDDLFKDVPRQLRYPKIKLPAPLSEMELMRELQERAGASGPRGFFLGAGAYRHVIPSVVDAVVSRSEFSTAYTPYQPEISQGTLQAIFEYQTMIARLTGMEVSNASHYDGATAAAEAVIMALNVHQHQRKRVLLSAGLNPQYREVVRTYTQGMGLEILGDERVGLGMGELEGMCDGGTACIVVQTPDFLGRVIPPDRMRSLASKAHACGALLVVSANPISLGLLVPPGACGADIVTGEGQPLGTPLSFGGPYLGFFAFRREHIRKSSGRIAGETTDADGKRGFVFTLSTREQHIRREKATSNICTNQSLVALAAAVYMSVMGPQGMRRVAELSFQKAHYAARLISGLPGFTVEDEGFFNEFPVSCPLPPARIDKHLFDDYGMIGGFDLGTAWPELSGKMLLCCTEVSTKAEIDGLVEALAKITARKPASKPAAKAKKPAASTSAARRAPPQASKRAPRAPRSSKTGKKGK